jgi:3-deoxy-7-phosphoheptulonate synthase
MRETKNLRIVDTTVLQSPEAVTREIPLSERAADMVFRARTEVENLLDGQDPRLLVIVGPCSIHDPELAVDYASRLLRLRESVREQLLVCMRVYFEKPRTTVGWKGLINDPHLDGTLDIPTGIRKARTLLREIAEMGMPAATELLDPIVPQYTADLLTWAAIGARTTESQTHREMASGLSMPVGFKNATDGSLQVAIDAMGAARTPHSFLGIDTDGATSIVRTSGNPDGHVVLRGGRARTNYDAESIRDAEATLKKSGLPPVMMVDCSHANSAKQFARQEDVWHAVIEQRAQGTRSLVGMMVESYLSEGNQPFPKPVNELKYGVSITDACVSWETTERMLRWGYEQLSRADKAALAAVS